MTGRRQLSSGDEHQCTAERAARDQGGLRPSEVVADRADDRAELGAVGPVEEQELLGDSLASAALDRGEAALLADDVRGVVGIRAEDLAPTPAGSAGLDRFAAGYHESIGLLIDAGLLEASLIDQSVQPKEVRS